MTAWVEESGHIDTIEILDASVVRMDVIAPTVAQSLQPGQFIMVRPPSAPWLPRAMAPFRWDSMTGRLTLYIRILGLGTQMLSQLHVHDPIVITGPLGQPLLLGRGPWALIGRGVGATPLWPIAQALSQRGEEVRVYLSARTPQVLLEPADFKKWGQVYCHTDSTDPHGRITQIFATHLKAGWRPQQVLVSGARRLQEDVWRAAQQWPFHAAVFVEEKMACGVGWCKGCAFGPRRQLLCVDGPALPLDEVM